jgi:hypothetical protein
VVGALGLVDLGLVLLRLDGLPVALLLDLDDELPLLLLPQVGLDGDLELALAVVWPWP